MAKYGERISGRPSYHSYRQTYGAGGDPSCHLPVLPAASNYPRNLAEEVLWRQRRFAWWGSAYPPPPASSTVKSNIQSDVSLLILIRISPLWITRLFLIASNSFSCVNVRFGRGFLLTCAPVFLDHFKENKHINVFERYVGMLLIPVAFCFVFAQPGVALIRVCTIISHSILFRMGPIRSHKTNYFTWPINCN